MKRRIRKQEGPSKEFQALVCLKLDFRERRNRYYRSSEAQLRALCAEFGLNPQTTRPEDLVPFIRAKHLFEQIVQQQCSPFDKPESTDFKWPELLAAMTHFGIELPHINNLPRAQYTQVIERVRAERMASHASP